VRPNRSLTQDAVLGTSGAGGRSERSEQEVARQRDRSAQRTAAGDGERSERGSHAVGPRGRSRGAGPRAGCGRASRAALAVLALLGCGSGAVGSAASAEATGPRALAAGGRTLFASAGQTCALLASGAVQCWGAGGSGQLGDGRLAVRRPLPVAVSGLPGPATAIAVGGSHACALLDGGVWCWGDNTRGQVAPEPPLLRLAPVRVAGLPEPVSALAAGTANVCALADGEVWCWGANEAGASGAAVEEDCRQGRRVRPCRTPPVRVAGLPGPARDLALGARHGCALVEGAVWCWGANDRGQRGDDDAAPRSRAGPVPALDRVRVDSLAAGAEHTCARAGGEVRCWGGGAGRPTAVSLPEAARALAAGGGASCASGGGAVWCWEADGAPVEAFAFESEVGALAVGADHVCAAAGADLRCRGDNDYGQLGSGDAPRDHVAPVRVRPWDTGVLRDRDGDGRIRVVCLGDSNTETPPGVAPSWCDRLAAQGSEAPIDPRLRVVNRGWGGSTARETASFFPARVPLRYALENDAPDVVLLAFGTNDVLAGEEPAAIAGALDALALRVREAGAEPFVALVPPVQPPDHGANEAVNRVNGLLRERWPAERLLDFHGGFGPEHFEDALHLDAAGQAQRAQRAAAALRRALDGP